MFMAGGAVLCTLATLVLLLQPQPALLGLHRQLGTGLHTIVLGIVPLLMGLALLLAGLRRADA
jgi:hypothetical protein